MSRHRTGLTLGSVLPWREQKSRNARYATLSTRPIWLADLSQTMASRETARSAQTFFMMTPNGCGHLVKQLQINLLVLVLSGSARNRRIDT